MSNQAQIHARHPLTPPAQAIEEGVWQLAYEDALARGAGSLIAVAEADRAVRAYRLGEFQ